MKKEIHRALHDCRLHRQVRPRHRRPFLAIPPLGKTLFCFALGVLFGPVIVAGDKKHHRILNPASSFMASHDPRVHVGLESDRFDRIEVLWPDGSFQRETFAGGPADRQLTLSRGQGVGTKANGEDNRSSRE